MVPALPWATMVLLTQPSIATESADMENRIADLERRADLFMEMNRRLAIEAGAARAVIKALMPSQPLDNKQLISRLATARLQMEATMLNRDQEDDALAQLQSCFDSYMSPDLLQSVLAFGDFDPKP